MGQINREPGGVGLKMEFSNALSKILPPGARLEGLGETLDDAVDALNRVSEALAEGKRPVWRIDGKLTMLLPDGPERQPLTCCVCHLDSITVYNRDYEAAYLVVNDKLVLIDTVRRARECDHWRVKLVGSSATIPVRDTAACYVSNNFNLTGETLKEVLNGSQHKTNRG